jgi:hypothetical protein
MTGCKIARDDAFDLLRIDSQRPPHLRGIAAEVDAPVLT